MIFLFFLFESTRQRWVTKKKNSLAHNFHLKKMLLWNTLAKKVKKNICFLFCTGIDKRVYGFKERDINMVMVSCLFYRWYFDPFIKKYHIKKIEKKRWGFMRGVLRGSFLEGWLCDFWQHPVIVSVECAHTYHAPFTSF